MLSDDGHQIQGWVTAPDVLRTIARQISTAQTQTAQAQATADWDLADPDALPQHPPTPLPGYRVIEITVTADSPAAGRKFGDVSWPRDSVPVAVLRGYRLRPPRPEITLATGDRISLLTIAPDGSPPRRAANESHLQAIDGSSTQRESHGRKRLLTTTALAAVLIAAGMTTTAYGLLRQDRSYARPHGIPARITDSQVNLMGLAPVPGRPAPGFTLTDHLPADQIAAWGQGIAQVARLLAG